MTTCRDCAKEVEPFKCAHWTCECGVGIAVCFMCSYDAYAEVDGKRRWHVCDKDRVKLDAKETPCPQQHPTCTP